MRRARSTFLTTISLAGAGFILAGCGSDSGEKASPAPEDHATHSAVPTKAPPTTPAIPTNASVEEYCAAFKGDEAKFAGITTTGEAADAFEDLLNNQRDVGTPATMPDETRQVFIDYMESGADFVAALRKIPEDSSISAMRTDKEFYDEWGGKLDTPQELRDYSAKNC